MARPKTIQLEQGTVSLSGFPKEVGDKLAAHIKSFNEPTIVVPVGSIEAAELPPISVAAPVEVSAPAAMSNSAIGVYKVGNDIHLVTVAYDFESGVAKVEKKEKADNVRESSMKFKMAADKHGFIR